MGQKQGYNTNPLVGLTREETLTNCLDQLEFLQQAGEELHPGYHTNFALLRGALGHELAQVAEETAKKSAVASGS